MIRRRVRLGVVAALVAVGALAMSAGPALAKPGAYKVLFVSGLGTCSATTFPSELAGEPGIKTLNTFNASTATPTVAQLDPYDMVVTASDCSGFADGATLGDHLVSYVKQGGVVVEYAFGADTSGTQDEITGNWVTDGYSPLIAGPAVNTSVTLGTYDASSPLMAGVSSLSSQCNTDSTLAPGATNVALWNSGQEAVAYKGQAIAVNNDIEDFCTPSPGYARLTLNAVAWRGRHYLTVRKTGKGSGRVKSSPHGIKCGKRCKAVYNFDQKVTLKAKGTKGSKFAGWGGACHGHKKTCKVTMSAAEKVKAKFKK